MNLIIVTFLAVSRATPTYSYEENGKDWGDIVGFEACAGTNQSPINLLTQGNEDFDYKEYNGNQDDLFKTYSNQYG